MQPRFLGRRTRLFFALCLLSAGSSVLGQESKKAPVPANEEIARAKALVKDLFAQEMAQVEKEPGTAAALAVRFLEEGRDTRDYPAGRYVLLLDARELASRGGDGPTALAAIEELHQSFLLPEGSALRMKIAALSEASKGTATPAGYQTLVDLTLGLLEDAVAADDYPSATQLAFAAEGAARKLRNVPLVAAIRKKQEEVARLEKEFAKWKPFADKLAKDPGDAKANTEMGTYYAFIRGDWEKGLEHLARGNVASLRALAKKDLADPRKGVDQVAVAEGWLKVSAALEASMKPQAILRSYHWFLQALGDLDGDLRKEVQKKLDSILAKLPPEYQIGEINGELRKCEGNYGPVYGLSFSPDGKKLVAGGADGALHVYDVRTGKESRRLDGHSSRIWTVAFAPDNRRILSGGFDTSIRLWDLVSGRESKKLPGHTDYVRSVVIHRDGHLALSGGDDRLVRFWNLDTGMEVRSFPGHDHFVWSVALSRDGKKALSASLDRTIRLWDVDAGVLIKKLEGHTDTVLSVAISADGRRAISGGTDKTIRVWDLQTGEILQTLTGHKGYVHSVALSPDGRRALSASQDRTVRLWDLQTGEEIRTLEGHSDQVWFVAFSRDGRVAASAGQDGTVRIWGNVK